MKSRVSLTDKYELLEGRAYMTGTQALVRLLLLQGLRDRALGLDTGGFVSGYRGSPLGSVDHELWRAGRFLDGNRIRFVPGVNEELAATAVWGTQQVNLFEGAKVDGVFGMWYGKGPGVDRSADALRHANAAGTSRRGGVLAVAGDDHACKSSTLPHQTEPVFQAIGMPVLAPAGVQDILDLGLHGWAMSRFSGCWVALKVTTDIVESSASVDVGLLRVQTVEPTDFALPHGGLGIRYPDPPLDQERRLTQFKLDAALAYSRANGLDRMVVDSPRARLGILSAGKSYLDVRQALDLLGIDDRAAAEIGLRLLKVGMVWPLDHRAVSVFAAGLEEILVIEEKAPFLEQQVKGQLYGWPDSARPRVVGKVDENGRNLLSAHGDLSVAVIARAIAGRIARHHTSERIAARLARLGPGSAVAGGASAPVQRTPHYCSGCPHNTSAKVPEGSRATAGIGCHGMATFIYPQTKLFTQMGGEGVPWIGQQPFTETRHVFANLGDGTYFHSGILAIRASVAAKVPITYKILYNDAVAMTGGQPVDGALSVPQISRQLSAEGVDRIVVVTDDPGKYKDVKGLARDVAIRHRDDLDAIQRALREYPGVSALIYDQTCAAEKRRRRKRGAFPDPARRVVIHEGLCEGCGDCSNASNCISVVPVETEFGTKRGIDQSACNKDFTCLGGFCPSMVTVEGGKLRRAKAMAAEGADAPEPILPSLNRPHAILITGVGGTGVVTIGALLGMAAHLEGKGVSVLDMAGLAQKGGAVWSHVRIADTPEHLHAARIGAAEATAVIGCDMVVAATSESLSTMQAGQTRAVVNADVALTGDAVRAFAAQAASGDVLRHGTPGIPADAMKQRIEGAVGEGGAEFIEATRIATALMGDSIATNLFMLGFAYQRGLIPLSAESLMRAIELNGAAVDDNKQSFLWGRLAAHDPASIERRIGPARTAAPPGLDQVVCRRVEFLTAYQDAAYARRYSDLVAMVGRAEESASGARGRLTEAVARGYFKLLAYKDEYEVARQYSNPDFRKKIKGAFEGDYTLVFHLAPPMFGTRKRAYGPWMLTAFRALAKLKGLRGTAFDIFARHDDRKLDRRLIADYERTITEVLGRLDAGNHDLAVKIASMPDLIRGYGHVRHRHLDHARRHEAELLSSFRQGGGGD